MVKNDINSARQLLLVLRKPELESLRTYLKSFNKMYGEYEPKTLRLLNVLVEEQRTSEEAIRNEISPDVSDNTFRMLVTRLKEKTYECLTLDMNTKRNEAYSAHYQTKFEIRKRLSQAEILHARGAPNEAIYIVNKAIALCKKYELFQLLVEALMQQQELFMVRKRGVDFAALQREIEFYRKCEDNCHWARYEFYRLASYEEFNGAEVNTNNAYLLVIEKLDQKLAETPSNLLRYWRQLIELNYLESIDSYAKAIGCAEALITFVKQKPAVKMPKRIGTAYIHLAHNALNCNNYHSSELNSRKALRHFEAESYNALLSEEYLFYSLFYKAEYKKAEAVVTKLLTKTDLQAARFKHAQRKYLKACVLFQQGKYRRVHFTLRDTVTLDRDKAGWNIGVRVLNIMNQVEWGGLEKPIDSFIENLYVYLNELRKSDDIPARSILILELLRALAKNSYKFEVVLRKHEKAIKLLADAQGEYSWRVPGPEPIRFEQWFLKMATAERKN